MYEYVIARTKVIDEILIECLKNGAEQVLVLGAGFDSRSIRLNKSTNAVFFEMDATATQKAKIDRYQQKHVTVPENIIFIPVDFDKQRVLERLSDFKFQKNKSPVFILEGLLMYLLPESVRELLNTINEFSGNGSTMIADSIYASVLRGDNIYLGEKELRNSTSKNNEKFTFGIEKADVENFSLALGLTGLIFWIQKCWMISISKTMQDNMSLMLTTRILL